MKHSHTDRVMALAGVFQAASLVDQIANKGMANNAFIESCLETLFKFDTDTVTEVYGGVIGLHHGLRTLQQQLGASRGERNGQITRYVISLLLLERKLAANSTMLDSIAEQLQQIESQLEFFNLSHDTIYAKLAELYKETVSTLGPKIMVSGEMPYLSNEHNANKVRALLLAGIRSAVLWRQCGGSRLQVLLRRKHYLHECEKLLAM